MKKKWLKTLRRSRKIQLKKLNFILEITMENNQVEPNNGKNPSIGNSQTILDPNDYSISVSGMLNDANNDNNINLINKDIENKKPEGNVEKIVPQNDINKEGEISDNNNDDSSNQQNKSCSFTIVILGEDNSEIKNMNMDLDENKEISSSIGESK